jgi:hypothetical protein
LGTVRFAIKIENGKRFDFCYGAVRDSAKKRVMKNSGKVHAFEPKNGNN